jgi:ATP-dependent DNA helicase RecG
MTVFARQAVATVDGILLFGKAPKRFLRHSGIRAVCYPGTEPDYARRADEDLRGPLVQLGAADGTLVETGLVEQAWDFVRRNTTPSAYLDGGGRIDRWEYPEEVVREVVVNALVHRDYSLVGMEIFLAIYADRLEIESPGSLPSTVTVEGMRAGARHARNQTPVNLMRDYRYIDTRGMGMRKVIPGMRAHNGTEPEFLVDDSRVTVRLWKDPPG